MSEKSLSETQPVSFGERLASSQVFSDLFSDGMALVEETATYLDGPGRQQSKTRTCPRRWLMPPRACASPRGSCSLPVVAATAR